MSKYLVKTPISSGDKKLPPGSAVEMSDELAKPLLACGAIEPVPNIPAKAETLAEPEAEPAPSNSAKSKK